MTTFNCVALLVVVASSLAIVSADDVSSLACNFYGYPNFLCNYKQDGNAWITNKKPAYFSGAFLNATEGMFVSPNITSQTTNCLTVSFGLGDQGTSLIEIGRKQGEHEDIIFSTNDNPPSGVVSVELKPFTEPAIIRFYGNVRAKGGGVAIWDISVEEGSCA